VKASQLGRVELARQRGAGAWLDGEGGEGLSSCTASGVSTACRLPGLGGVAKSVRGGTGEEAESGGGLGGGGLGGGGEGGGGFGGGGEGEDGGVAAAGTSSDRGGGGLGGGGFGGGGLGGGGLGGGELGTEGGRLGDGLGGCDDAASSGGGKGGALMDAHSRCARQRAAAAPPLGAASVRQKVVKLTHCPMFISTHPCARDTAGMQGKASLVSWVAPRQAV
jgi:hypothetical protein